MKNFYLGLLLVFMYSLTACNGPSKEPSQDPQNNINHPNHNTGPQTNTGRTPPFAVAPHNLVLTVQDPVLNRVVTLNLIEIPAVTTADVAELQANLNREGAERALSSGMPEAMAPVLITEPLPAFRASTVKTPVGLYHAIMRRFPDVTQCERIPRGLTQENLLRAWTEHPNLPLTCINLADMLAFILELNRQTDRNFSLPTAAQNEYLIRGRNRNTDGTYSSIVTTQYYFGNNTHRSDLDHGEAFLAEHAFLRNNSFVIARNELARTDLNRYLPFEVNFLPVLQENYFINSFQMIHPIGNVWAMTQARQLPYDFRLGRDHQDLTEYVFLQGGSLKTHVGLGGHDARLGEFTTQEPEIANFWVGSRLIENPAL